MKKKPKTNKEPSDYWKKSVLFPEHSPIRSVIYRISIENIKSWVATHLVRHHVGTQPYVSTQRTDRTNSNLNRDDYPQGNLINISILLNAQSFINISKERLCSCASKETKDTWIKVLNKLKQIDPVLAHFCVPKCIYRGFCTEHNTCGYINTSGYTNKLLKYRNGVIK